MPRFVIQRHEKQGEQTHWDLMLQQDQTLKTFRLDLPPAALLHSPAQALPIFDHDPRFLTYQGPVNQGLGRVTLADRGTYTTAQQTRTRWELVLAGETLSGRFVLIQANANLWQFGRLEVK